MNHCRCPATGDSLLVEAVEAMFATERVHLLQDPRLAHSHVT